VSIDALRRRGRRKRGGRGWGKADESVLEGIEASGDGPAEEAQRREDRQRVLGALRSMPEEYRAPLMLRYFSGADYDTIGRELGLTNGSLRGMLSRGMGMLKRQLGPAARR
jgi:RNA polymerase sigma factor (sigma-70 family)